MKHITHESILQSEDKRVSTERSNNISEITLLELAAIVIKRDIIESTTKEQQIDIEGIIDELVDTRARELIRHNKKIRYTFEQEAFTCEICNNNLIVLKHSSVDKAIRFALSNIANIHIVFKDKIVVIGGKSNRNIGDIQNTDYIMYTDISGLVYMVENFFNS